MNIEVKKMQSNLKMRKMKIILFPFVFALPLNFVAYAQTQTSPQNQADSQSQVSLFMKKIQEDDQKKKDITGQAVVVPAVDTKKIAGSNNASSTNVSQSADDDVQSFDDAESKANQKQGKNKKHHKDKDSALPVEDQYEDVYLDHADNFRKINHSKPYMLNGVVYYKFGKGEPLILCSTMHVCDIQLENGEEVTSVQVGDSSRWIITVKKSTDKTGVYAHVELKPVSNNLESNLIIFTDKRNYVMTVKSSKSKKYFSRVAFNYEDEPANKKISVVYSSIPARSKYDYRIRGDRMPWTPLQILTDGKKTYIELPKQYYHSKDMPVLHALDDDGVSSIINTRQFQNYLIVDVMLDKGELVQNVGNNQKKIVFTRSGTVGVISKLFN